MDCGRFVGADRVAAAAAAALVGAVARGLRPVPVPDRLCLQGIPYVPPWQNLSLEPVRLQIQTYWSSVGPRHRLPLSRPAAAAAACRRPRCYVLSGLPPGAGRGSRTLLTEEPVPDR